MSRDTVSPIRGTPDDTGLPPREMEGGARWGSTSPACRQPDVSPAADAAARFDALARAHRVVADAIGPPERPRTATPVPSQPLSGASFGHWRDRSAWIIVGPVHVDPLPRATALDPAAEHAQPGEPHRRH